MPYQNPPSRQAGKPQRGSEALRGLAQAESLMQIALVLPCALVIGWGAGWWIDHHFHTHWATLPGLILGLISGMVSVVRMALAAGSQPRPRSAAGDAAKNSTSNTPNPAGATDKATAKDKP